MSRRLVALVAVLVLTAAATPAPDWETLQILPYEPPKPAPALSLPDLDGKTQTLEALRGNVVILYFWATW